MKTFPIANVSVGDNKDIKYKTQLQNIFAYLQDHIATGSMVSHATGVPHKNFCTYKANRQAAGRLQEVRKGICELTGHKAFFLTTNPERFPNKSQLALFPEGGPDGK